MILAANMLIIQINAYKNMIYLKDSHQRIFYDAHKLNKFEATYTKSKMAKIITLKEYSIKECSEISDKNYSEFPGIYEINVPLKRVQ